MRRWLAWSISPLVGAVALALAIPLAVTVSSNEHNDFIQGLQIQTLSAASVLASQPSSEWPTTATEIAARTGARTVVVDAQGRLVADSDGTTLGRPFERPETTEALGGSLVVDVRPSTTAGGDLRVVAAPVVQDAAIVAAVRLTLREDAVDAAVRSTQAWLAVFVLAVLVAALALAWLLARWIGAPLERLAAVAEALPDDLSLRAQDDEGPSEVRSVATALNTTAARLDGLVERTRRVAADASHHLRTPLTGILLRLEAIEEVSDQERVRREAAEATLEVQRLTRRIGQVLDLARSDAATPLPGSSCEASDIITDRLDAATALTDERELAVERLVEPGVRAAIDAGSLARIVDELLGNACDYAVRMLRVTLASDGAVVRLLVEDDGAGVADDERELVFSRFARGSTAVPGGSGLGLALVRESARAAGGDARASRSDLGGLRVEVSLPAS